MISRLAVDPWGWPKISDEPQLFIPRITFFCPSCHQKRMVEFGEWL
jgi:hypothetical protein